MAPVIHKPLAEIRILAFNQKPTRPRTRHSDAVDRRARNSVTSLLNLTGRRKDSRVSGYLWTNYDQYHTRRALYAKVYWQYISTLLYTLLPRDLPYFRAWYSTRPRRRTYVIGVACGCPALMYFQYCRIYKTRKYE